MPTYLVALATPVPASHSEQLAQRVYYVAPDIAAFRLVREGDTITGVELTTAAEADHAALARRLDDVSSTEVLPQRLSTPQVVWRSPHAPRPATGVFDAMAAAGVAHEMGDGAVATGPPFSTVLDALDARVRGIATRRFGAVEYRYPTLVSTAALRRGNYLTSFPQLLMSASRLCVDLDVYRRFVAELDAAGDPGPLLTRYGTHAGYCLPPTMCFHTYHQFAGRTLAADRLVVTARGRSFRFESRYSRTLERLWDFTIRETVFLGDETTVADLRSGFVTAACALAEELGLAGRVESADDPFFAGRTVPRRVLAQRLGGLKYELRVPAEEGRTFSVASFNVHGTTFGGPYDIRLPDGDVAHTACVGFGLERFAFALFCQHGADIRDWPAGLRDSIATHPPRG